MKMKPLIGALLALGLASHASAQTAPAGEAQRITITGSSIKRIASEGALPVQVISRTELERQGIASTEQLIMNLNINGNGLDNLASNADVVDGAARGNNGASSANLRGQGSNATLILLNGRRVAAHGLNGGTVDLNQIPWAALDRVEVLKDGASAIYGTDAIGGVINFILRTNVDGATINLMADVPQLKGGAIYTAALTAGFGNLDTQGFNFMASLGVQDYKKLRGDQRNFVNTFQPDRGLAPDTRGAPIATVFAVGQNQANVLSRDNINAAGRGTGPLDFVDPTLRVNGINTLDLPGQAGCGSVDGMSPYQEALWATPASKYGCAWDTGRAAVIQQPVTNTSIVSRLTFKLGEHQLFAEGVFGRSESAKSFSANQITSGTGTANTSLPNGTTVPSPFRDLAYPSTGASYNQIFNTLVQFFPAIEANRGRGIAFRWRCLPCGDRELKTTSDTARVLIGAEGTLPFLGGWDYKAGVAQATSKSDSEIGSGYHYWAPFAALINNGTLNPFSLTQTPQALAQLEAISARGVKLYGGEFTMQQIDASASGSLGFKLPGGTVLGAIGMDFRTEKYKFDGDQRPNANTVEALVFNVPFDNALATAGTLKRDIKAVYAEVMLPIVKGLELTVAARTDEYSGFGRTNNPKVSLKYAPNDLFLIRGAYSTGFRVPTFKQQFDPVTQATYVGADYTDPARCPTRTVSNLPGCNAINPLTLFGGKSDLEPEEAKMQSLGFVIAPSADFSANVDWWTIEREGTIQSFGLTVLSRDFQLFPDRFIRNANGDLIAVDTRWINAGETQTSGLEVGAKAGFNAGGGRWTAGFDVSYLLKKRSRLVASAPFGASEVGVFTRAGDLGIRWKHTLSVGYSQGDWTALLSQVYRGRYADFVLPGVANGSVRPANWNPIVEPYDIWNFSLGYRGIKNMVIIAGVKNALATEPPFSVTYDTSTSSSDAAARLRPLPAELATLIPTRFGVRRSFWPASAIATTAGVVAHATPCCRTFSSAPTPPPAAGPS
jgi:iron complex outermembrane recepter protein